MKKFIVFLALITYLPLLLNSGIFWDDWKIFNMTRAGIDEQFWGAGSYSFISDLHYYLQQTGDPILVYRIIIVLSTVLTAYVFYLILARFNQVTAYQRLLATIFFLINPFFSARITMICVPYTLSLLFFTTAFYLFLIAAEKKQYHSRIFSLILFFISFIANSLLFFYLIVPLYLSWDFAKSGWKVIGRRMFAFLDFLILPLLFWSIKLIWFQPQGLYKLGGYNKISLHSFLASAVNLFISIGALVKGFMQPFFERPHYMIFLALFLLIAMLMLIRGVPNEAGNSKVRGRLFLLALFLSLIAIYPYSLVGKHTSFHGYDTRNQLLLPFGFSILLMSILDSVKNRYAHRVLFAIIVTALTYFNLQQQFHYLVGWLKQEAVMSNFQQPIFLPEINTIEVDDHTPRYNATDEPILFFEWNGMAKYVFENEKRLFMTPDLLAVIPENISLRDYVIFFRKNQAVVDHNMSAYLPDGTCYRMRITQTGLDLDNWNSVMDLTWKYYFERNNFKSTVRQYVEIRFEDGCSTKLKSIL